MVIYAKGTRITIDLGNRDLYRQLRIAAVEEDLTIREIVIEAVQYWLSHREEIEDELAAQKLARVAAESTGEYITHGEVKDRLRQEQRKSSDL